MLTTNGKNIILSPYQTLLSCEIGKSGNPTLGYVWNPRYDVKNLIWGSALNNEISTQSISFDIPAGAEPDAIVATNLNNYTYGVQPSGVLSETTQYFNSYADMMKAQPFNSGATARVGKRYSDITYNFILVPVSIDYASNLLLETFTWNDFTQNQERLLYDRVFTAIGRDIYDDFEYVIQVNGSQGTHYYIAIKMGEENETTAYPTTPLDSVKVVYPIADHYPTQMEFGASSVIKINEIKITIGG